MRSRGGEDKGVGFFRGLVYGVLAGAGLFYFLTNTEEGEKVRKKIKKQGKQALDNLNEIVGDLEEKGKEFKEKAQELQTDLEKKVEGVKKEMTRETKEDLSQIEKLRKRGQRVARLFTRGGETVKPSKKKSA